MKIFIRRQAYLTPILALALSACSVGPDFMRPAIKLEDAQYMHAADENIKLTSINRWWEQIDDPLLTQYVETLLNENLSLLAAGERILQARERANVAGGEQYPSIGIEGRGSRNFTTISNPNRGSDRLYTNSYESQLTTSWQLDLFGRVRRSIEAADASLNANIYEYEALTHSLIAELVNRRVSIAAYQELLRLAQDNVTNREKNYTLIKRRYDQGAAGTIAEDIYLAEENISSVQADASQFERQLTEEIYRLDVLLGYKPGSTAPTSQQFTLLPPPRGIPACMPADLLDRRPDLRASELRIKAANADIGIAVADLYPTLNLTANLGASGTDIVDLFDLDSLAGALIGSVTSRLFAGGALRANIRLQEAEARELVAIYSDNVLNALREVETALQAETALEQELERLSASLLSLQNAERLSWNRYERGRGTLRAYLDTQQRRYAAQQTYISRQQEKWAARIALYLALGGDWMGPIKPTIKIHSECNTGTNHEY